MNDHTDRTDRKKLSIWMDEWRLDRALAAADGTDGEAGSEDAAAGLPRLAPGPPPSFADGLRVGDILLLKPVTPVTARRPTYVVVVAPGGAAGWWRVAPFARFSTPATPEEVATGLKAHPLRVLCLWNGHAVSARRLTAWAWRVSRIAPAALARIGGAGDGRRGPRLVHPLDPRHTYLDEERALWNEWDRAAQAADAADAPTPAENGSAATDVWENARAAEDPAGDYGE
jgi:hypothetical protein